MGPHDQKSGRSSIGRGVSFQQTGLRSLRQKWGGNSGVQGGGFGKVIERSYRLSPPCGGSSETWEGRGAFFLLGFPRHKYTP